MSTAFPLAWPPGWPRTPRNRRENGRSRWSHEKKPWTFDAARRELAAELDRHNVTNVILSTNYELRLDGQPRAGSSPPDDVGIAVYFHRKGRPVVMARDAFDRAEENIRSLTLALKAMRAIEEHGGAMMMDRAFEGFVALVAPGSRRAWWEVLGVSQHATPDQINAAWRDKAKTAHSDAGGTDAAMSELNVARDQGLKSRQAA